MKVVYLLYLSSLWRCLKWSYLYTVNGKKLNNYYNGDSCQNNSSEDYIEEKKNLVQLCFAKDSANVFMT